jgi:hypothetical protein
MALVRRISLGLVVPVCLAAAVAGQPASPDLAVQARAALRTLPLHFEPNLGQWDSHVRFAARTGNYSLALKDAEATLVPVAGGPSVSLSLAGANPAPRVEGIDPLPGRSQYFLGNRPRNWRTGVPQYGRVRYRDVYPGVDLVYYGQDARLEYDFLLQPGADPARIRMRFNGSSRISISPQGDLLLDTAAGQVVQKRPLIYQADARTGARRAIAGRYRLLGKNMAGVVVGGYDRSQPLTIDPVLQYATLFGGAGADGVTAVRVDEKGFIYVAGYMTTSGFDSGGGTQTALAGKTDGFVAKVDPNFGGPASLVYFTYLGGTDLDFINDMVLDAANRIYLTGSTLSTDFPSAGNAVQPAHSKVVTVTGLPNEDSDAFVTVLDLSQQGTNALVYSSYLGGQNTDEGRGIAVDAAGLIYVTGSTMSGDFPITASAFQNALWGSQDAFIAKIDPSTTTLAYSSFLGGNDYDDGRSIVVTPDGMAYATGATLSEQYPWNGSVFHTTLQGPDIWLAQVDTTKSGVASMPYVTYFGGSGWDEPEKLALDPQGKVWLTGFTLSPDFPVTADAFQPRPNSPWGQAFVTRLDIPAAPSALVLYSTYLGGTLADVALSLTVDANGMVYVTGYAMSPDFPTTPDGIQSGYPGGIDAFLTKLDPSKPSAQALVYSTFLGHIGIHFGQAVAVGSNGTIALGGLTGFQHIDTTDTGVQTTYAGGISDGFLVVLRP